MRVAAIGIGSNSLRMILADIVSEKLVRIKRYRDGLRLFAALDQNGCIQEAMMEEACKKIQAFCSLAKGDGAEVIHLFATSAVRDAANNQVFSALLREATGLELDICDGSKEAALSYWGAYEGENCTLIDIGGGSTEVICGRGTSILCAKSFQTGAVRLYRSHPVSSLKEAVQVKDEVVELFRTAQIIPQPGCSWIGVGGTFTTSALMLKHTPWEERTNVHGSFLDRSNIAGSLDELVKLTVEERKKLPWIQPQRADIIVHGLIILLACFDCWNIPVIKVSEYGNLEGYLRYCYDCK